jgi:hypothetical protein
MYQPVQKVIVIGVPRHDQSAFEVYWSLLFHCHVTRHPGYKQGAIALGRINMTNHTGTMQINRWRFSISWVAGKQKGATIGMVHPCIWHHKLGNLGD